MKFSQLTLDSKIQQALTDKGYTQATPIQAQAIPVVLTGKDLLAAAQTGTGKTAGFTLPILQRLLAGKAAGSNQVRALILTPTRELAAQVQQNVQMYSQHLPLRSQVVFGGVKINPQMQKLRAGCDVLVATPGRLLDLYNQGAVKFSQLEVLVLDEADRMLDMGFIHDIRRIIKLLPTRRQNLLFSATFSDSIRQLAKTIVRDPIEVEVAPANAAAEPVQQLMYPVDKNQKTKLLIHLINSHQWQQVLVFSRTKHGANRLVKQLEAAGITAAAIHGNKSQGARTRALAQFKANDIRILVATDIAARGIDIHQLPQVVNFDLPNVSADYVHRIGRTGRAGATGCAISLICADEKKELADIERLIQQHIERCYSEKFTPSQEVAVTDLAKRVKKPKKPKALKTDSQKTSVQGSAKAAASKPAANKPAKRSAKKTQQRSGQQAGKAQAARRTNNS